MVCYIKNNRNIGIENSLDTIYFGIKIKSPMSAFMSQYIPNYEPLLYCIKKGIQWWKDK